MTDDFEVEIQDEMTEESLEKFRKKTYVVGKKYLTPFILCGVDEKIDTINDKIRTLKSELDKLRERAGKIAIKAYDSDDENTPIPATELEKRAMNIDDYVNALDEFISEAINQVMDLR